MWSDERWKVARRCGAKHIWKSKCTKHTILEPLLEVVMSKKCTPLWREAHLEVNMYTPRSEHFWKLRCWKSKRRRGAKMREAHFGVKSVKNSGYWALLDVQMSFCVAGAGDCAQCQKWAKCEGFVAASTTTTTTLHPTPLHYTAFHYNYNCDYHYTTLHYTILITPLTTTTATATTTTTLHYATLRYATLRYATLLH